MAKKKINIKEAAAKQSIQETIILCLVDNNLVDTVEVHAIDDWHYQIAGEMRLWRKKENHLANMFNPALEKAGWNMRVEVKFKPIDDESFIIDINTYTCRSYFVLQTYYLDCNAFDREVQVSRDPDEFYLHMIKGIFQETEDTDERVDRITDMLQGAITAIGNEEYNLLTVKPQLLLETGHVLVLDYTNKDFVLVLNPKDYTAAEWDEVLDYYEDEGLELYFVRLTNN